MVPPAHGATEPAHARTHRGGRAAHHKNSVENVVQEAWGLASCEQRKKLAVRLQRRGAVVAAGAERNKYLGAVGGAWGSGGAAQRGGGCSSAEAGVLPLRWGGASTSTRPAR